MAELVTKLRLAWAEPNSESFWECVESLEVMERRIAELEQENARVMNGNATLLRALEICSDEEARLRRLIREELDRKPAGHEEYAMACVAWFEHDRLKGAAWDPGVSNKLQDAAHAARPKQ